MPGPLGTNTNNPAVDEGTMCRQASSAPGTTCQTKNPAPNCPGGVVPIPLAPRLLPPSSRRPAAYSISRSGLQFIYHEEAYRGVSNHLHWPGGKSGVTLGPGYDMRERETKDIYEDMIAIGLDPATSEKVSKAAHLRNEDAEDFADDNIDLVDLSKAQEMELLNHIVPHYEAIVRRMVHINLRQHEFDAMVSYVYNPGGHLKRVMRDINHGHVARAMAAIMSAVGKDPSVREGLIIRRKREVALFLHARYVTLRVHHKHKKGKHY
jgi:hypothetical protein